MGHFELSLPNNGHADVHFGTVRKKQLLSLRNLFTGKWWHTEKCRGYVVIIDKNKKVVLFKTQDGAWTNENSQDEQYTYLQAKIDEFENINH